MTKIFGREIFQQRLEICDKENLLIINRLCINLKTTILIIKIEYKWNIKIN
jgi:hypothetical protein